MFKLPRLGLWCYGSPSRLSQRPKDSSCSPGLPSSQDMTNRKDRLAQPSGPDPARQRPLVPMPRPSARPRARQGLFGGRTPRRFHPHPLGASEDRLPRDRPGRPPTLQPTARALPGSHRAIAKGRGRREVTHSTRSCLSPTKSFLWIRVMLLPLSSLVEARRERNGEMSRAAPRPGLSSTLPLHLPPACHLFDAARCFPAKPRDPQVYAQARQAKAHLGSRCVAGEMHEARAPCWESRGSQGHGFCPERAQANRRDKTFTQGRIWKLADWRPFRWNPR